MRRVAVVLRRGRSCGLVPRRSGSVVGILALVLGGCAAVGPNYTGPPEVAQTEFAAGRFRRAAEAPVSPAPPPARWWEAVGDPTLTRLIDEAFAASPTLASAVAQVRSARAQQAQNRAALGPTGGASARYVRSRIPTGSITSGSAAAGSSGSTSIPDPIQIETWSVSTDATWEIDLFGGRRRAIESAGAAVEARQAALEDAQVTLASDMGQAYAQLREAQNRVAYAHRTVRLREDALMLTRQRRLLGTAAEGDIETAQAALAQARAELPALQTTVVQQLDQIALLAGRPPGAYDALLGVPEDQQVSQPLPPGSVPVGEPADWLRRRPDIREAERQLAARNATIGVNVAALFPSVSVIGFAGTMGSHLGDLFKGAPLWLATPSLTWNFLSIPTNRARVRGAEADRDASLADYQRAVLAALQDANDALFRFGRQREALAQRELARDAAVRAARITRDRYAAGTLSLIDALDSERQRVQAEDAAVQAQSGLLRAYVSLNKSLGLGWGAAPPEEGSTARASNGPVDAASANGGDAGPGPSPSSGGSR